jgi:DNA modification methylase
LKWSKNENTMEKWLADNIKLWPIDNVLPYSRNARTHSDDQVTQIAASIAEFGFVNPCLVGEDGVLVAGHGRLMAARKLGMAEVPVVVLEHLSLTQRRALVLADNKLAQNAGWDEELLRVEIAELRDAAFDVDLLGFSEEEMDAMLALDDAVIDGASPEDEAPEVDDQNPPITAPGDVWELGRHRLVCGDSTTADAYVLLFAGEEKADMVFTDPPYNVAYASGNHEHIKKRPIMNDALGEGFYDFLYDAISLMLTHCDGAAYIAMSSSELDTLQAAFRNAGGHWSTFITWVKDRFTLGRSDYQRQYEPILYGWREGASHHWCGDRNQGDVWQIARPIKNDLHPTMKPVELVERAIQNSSTPGDIVLDPFGGSGSSLIAAEKTGRTARIIELDPKYCDVIVRRWQEWTGKSATLKSDGKIFDELVCDE